MVFQLIYCDMTLVFFPVQSLQSSIVTALFVESPILVLSVYVYFLGLCLQKSI